MRGAHEGHGHYGVRRALLSVTAEHWWYGVYWDGEEFVRRCGVCDRVRTSFVPRQEVLHPLPIMGMFYRWSVDVAGPLPRSQGGHTYITVMIEHFSKWVVVVPIHDKELDKLAAILQDRVVCTYGAPAEVLTDQGTEFRGSF